ncbi:unnamed protein product [Alopecurus aequalis]
MATLPRNKTWSAHRSTFLWGTHQFDIIGYSARKELGVRNTARSGDFEAGGCTWALVCCFDAVPDSKRQLASINLELVSSSYGPDEDVIATASLRIDDPTPPGKNGRHRCPPAVWHSAESNTFPATFTASANNWKLSIPEAFREGRHVKDDRLTIHCTVGVFREEGAAAAATRDCSVSVVPPPSISQDLRILLLDGLESSDDVLFGTGVTFIVEGTEIHAHKLVLAMRSPVFAAELLGGMKESATCSRVNIDDMSVSTFKAMLYFIYTDELPAALDPGNDNNAGKSHVAMAGDLLVAADRYDLERLRLMCEKILAENIGVASVMTTLMLVHGRDSCRQL